MRIIPKKADSSAHRRFDRQRFGGVRQPYERSDSERRINARLLLRARDEFGYHEIHEEVAQSAREALYRGRIGGDSVSLQ